MTKHNTQQALDQTPEIPSVVQRVCRRGAGATQPPAATKTGEPVEDPRNRIGKEKEANEAVRRLKREKSTTATEEEEPEDTLGKTKRDLDKQE